MKSVRGWMLTMTLLPPVVHSDTPPVGRNPFQPMAERVSGEDAIALWRLEGVIGQVTGWSGWISAPGQGWVMVNVGDAVATTGWVVRAIDECGVQVEKCVVDASGDERQWVRKLPAAGLSQRP